MQGQRPSANIFVLQSLIDALYGKTN